MWLLDIVRLFLVQDAGMVLDRGSITLGMLFDNAVDKLAAGAILLEGDTVEVVDDARVEGDSSGSFFWHFGDTPDHM